MAELQTRIFVGTTADEATAQLAAALADGSFVVGHRGTSPPGMWITHHEVIPGVMQQPSYELHVTAWVEVS